jgi:glutathione S-transferase
MNWVSLIILLAALQSLAFGGLVAWARGKYKVAAPAISGNEVFERFFRVHYNTNELLFVFMPSIWFFGSYLSPLWASVLGGTYLLGRVIYAIGYVRSPKQREIGFVMSAVPAFILLAGAIYGAVCTIIIT